MGTRGEFCCVFSGAWELMEEDVWLRWMEMKGRWRKMGSGSVFWIQEMGDVTYCSSIGTVILFCDRLCLNQKNICTENIKSSKQNITMNISPYAGTEKQHSGFFPGKDCQSLLLAWTPGNLYELRPKGEWVHRFHKKNTEANWIKILLLARLPILLRCSLLQPQI